MDLQNHSTKKSILQVENELLNEKNKVLKDNKTEPVKSKDEKSVGGKEEPGVS